MRLAIVHDYLLQMGGAERVVAVLAETFPDALIYTSATDRDRLLAELSRRTIVNTWLNTAPGIRKHFKKYFAVYPLAFRSLRPIDAEVVLISSSGYSKWVRTVRGATTFCYCHTPPRFFWDPNEYLRLEIRNSIVRRATATVIPILRQWDYRAAQEMDYFIANSRCVQERIGKFYGRNCVVIHPPVDVRRFCLRSKPENYYLVVSRLVGYKRIDRAIEAFNALGERLVIVGDGPDRARLEQMAGPTVQFVGRVNDEQTKNFLEGARAYIFPGVEDFGIVAVEAQACGRPVIAFGGGGALETVVPDETGILFQSPTAEDLAEAVRRAQNIYWDCEWIRSNALRFDSEIFKTKMRAFVTGGRRVKCKD